MDYKDIRVANVRKIADICTDINKELELTEDASRSFLYVVLRTVVDTLGYESAAQNFCESVAELAIVLQTIDMEPSKAFAKTYGSTEPKKLYDMYLKQLAAVPA